MTASTAGWTTANHQLKPAAQSTTIQPLSPPANIAIKLTISSRPKSDKLQPLIVARNHHDPNREPPPTAAAKPATFAVYHHHWNLPQPSPIKTQPFPWPIVAGISIAKCHLSTASRRNFKPEFAKNRGESSQTTTTIVILNPRSSTSNTLRSQLQPSAAGHIKP